MRAISRLKAACPTHFLSARYPLPKSLPSGKGLAFALAGSISGVSPLRNLCLLLKFRKSSNLLSASAYLRAISRLKAACPTHFLSARYPLPKSLPSGKGLAFALAGSISGVSPLRNLCLLLKFRKSSNLLSASAYLRAISRLKAACPRKHVYEANKKYSTSCGHPSSPQAKDQGSWQCRKSAPQK